MSQISTQPPNQAPTASRLESANVARWRRALDDLWNLNRCHAGTEASLAYRKLAEHYPGTEVFGVRSGERSGSWIAPPGWEVRHARLVGPDGTTLADYDVSKLHLFMYSPPFKGSLSRAELMPHLMSNRNRPHIIPFHFRNQYRHWAPEWGFCLRHDVLENLPDGKYEIDIDTEFTDDRMEMAEQAHRGELDDSLLLVGHFDHPALCNDGLVGCLAGHEVISRLAGRQTRLTYRMLSTVEIVGSVFYAEREAKARKVREGLFVGMSGAPSPFLFQRSSGGAASIDRAMEHVLKHSAPDARIAEFREEIGNDETAFDCAGVNIPCASLLRGRMPHYHSSDDTPDNVHDDKFEEMVDVVLKAIDVLEQNAILQGTFSGLPCLANPEIDLYLNRLYMSGFSVPPNDTARRLIEGLPGESHRREALRWEANMNRLMTLLPALANGRTTTLDLAERSGVPFAVAHAYTELWLQKGLLQKNWVHPFERP
jgi:aminopeptidase-like protein